MVLNFDLNYPPCEGSSASVDPQGASTEPIKGLFGSPIDVEETDDDVVLLPSSTAFPQRRNKPRRNHGMTIDLEQAMEIQPAQSGVAAILLSLSSKSNHESTSTNINNVCHQTYFDLEGGDLSKWQVNNDVNSSHIHTPSGMMTFPMPLPPPSPPPPRTERIPCCPLCMDRFTHPCSTQCGHIFCKACIEASIAASVKNKTGRQCPTCRAKLQTKKSFHRVYLPFED